MEDLLRTGFLLITIGPPGGQSAALTPTLLGPIYVERRRIVNEDGPPGSEGVGLRFVRGLVLFFRPVAPVLLAPMMSDRSRSGSTKATP